ncbi:MAG: hypothetical protein JWN86_1546 [Planctomycetota bacterium]|nr:hypothetical protein [Planctomycetota bacterium]
MKGPRLSIAKAMTVVAILAMNMATLRTLHSYDEDLAQGVALTGFALQFGIFQSIRSRGQVRTFWIGFVATGSAAMMTFARCVAFHESTVSLSWIAYTKYANKYLNKVTHVWDFYNSSQIYPILVITLAIVWSVPQLVLALFGGLMARSLLKWRGESPAGNSGPRTDAIAPIRQPWSMSNESVARRR